MPKAVIAIAKSEAEAECILAELRRGGFSDNSASALFPDRHGREHLTYEQHSKAPELAMLGALSGAIIGAVIGFIVVAGLLIMPGARHVSAAGPLFGTLGCVALAATVFGILGTLIGLRIPKFEAKQSGTGKTSEGILMSVHCDNKRQASVARRILSAYGRHKPR